jgi:hypothetical protein
MFAQLGAFGEHLLAEHGLAGGIDAQALLLIFPNGFLAAVVDEPGQKLAVGGSIYTHGRRASGCARSFDESVALSWGSRREVFLYPVWSFDQAI